MRVLDIAVAALALSAAMLAVAHAAVTAENFQLHTTGDLVALCTVTRGESMAIAAIHFCEGFDVGVARTLQSEDAARPNRRPLFCLPNPRPTRDEAATGFVQWARADQQRLSLPPADGVANYLASTYPCSRS